MMQKFRMSSGGVEPGWGSAPGRIGGTLTDLGLLWDGRTLPDGRVLAHDHGPTP